MSKTTNDKTTRNYCSLDPIRQRQSTCSHAIISHDYCSPGPTRQSQAHVKQTVKKPIKAIVNLLDPQKWVIYTTPKWVIYTTFIDAIVSF
jgi:hypothetical protein